jgi:hypothetical protein
MNRRSRAGRKPAKPRRRMTVTANGQVVLVATESIGPGFPPLRTVYYVAEGDANKAEAIIANIMAPNEKVEAYGVLPAAAVKALGLKPGEFITA